MFNMMQEDYFEQYMRKYYHETIFMKAKKH